MRLSTLGLGLAVLSLGGCVGQSLTQGQSFPVFFAVGRATLDAPGRAVVARAADRATHFPDQPIAVTGYAATTPATALAYQRARAIARGLAQDGIAPARITTGVSTDKTLLATALADRRVDIRVGPDATAPR